jgi:hypothetical protein
MAMKHRFSIVTVKSLCSHGTGPERSSWLRLLCRLHLRDETPAAAAPVNASQKDGGAGIAGEMGAVAPFSSEVWAIWKVLVHDPAG